MAGNGGYKVLFLSGLDAEARGSQNSELLNAPRSRERERYLVDIKRERERESTRRQYPESLLARSAVESRSVLARQLPNRGTVES